MCVCAHRGMCLSVWLLQHMYVHVIPMPELSTGSQNFLELILNWACIFPPAIPWMGLPCCALWHLFGKHPWQPWCRLKSPGVPLTFQAEDDGIKAFLTGAGLLPLKNRKPQASLFTIGVSLDLHTGAWRKPRLHPEISAIDLIFTPTDTSMVQWVTVLFSWVASSVPNTETLTAHTDFHFSSSPEHSLKPS